MHHFQFPSTKKNNKNSGEWHNYAPPETSVQLGGEPPPETPHPSWMPPSSSPAPPSCPIRVRSCQLAFTFLYFVDNFTSDYTNDM